MTLALKIPRRLVVGETVMLPCHRTPERYTMPIPAALLTDEAAAYLIYRELADGWERRERDLLDEALVPAAVFVDVGAHWGIYTLHAATAGATVIAIEPDPFNRAMLGAWLAANRLADRVTVVAAAVSDRAGTAHLQRNTSMGHALVAEPADPAAVHEGGPFDGQPVFAPTELLRLDDLALPAGRPVVLKVDVEGAELAVFAGAAGLLASGRVTRILWEMNDGYDAISRLLAESGFRSTALNSENALSTPV